MLEYVLGLQYIVYFGPNRVVYRDFILRAQTQLVFLSDFGCY
jgi:hypothetical protein